MKFIFRSFLFLNFGFLQSVLANDLLVSESYIHLECDARVYRSLNNTVLFASSYKESVLAEADANLVLNASDSIRWDGSVSKEKYSVFPQKILAFENLEIGVFKGVDTKQEIILNIFPRDPVSGRHDFGRIGLLAGDISLGKSLVLNVSVGNERSVYVRCTQVAPSSPAEYLNGF